MSMLSKVAERVYWIGRYLERAENTARLATVYANMLLDLPAGVKLSWFNLVTLNGSRPIFDEHYKNRDERNVVKFLLADRFNPGSMLSSIAAARENVRTTRDVVPSWTWEQLNELYHYTNDHVNRAISRRDRFGFLVEIIRGCQQLTGLLSGSMRRDEAWLFRELGREVERADMITRILEAGLLTMLQAQEEEMVAVQRTVWVSVLESLSAHQAYRHVVRARVSSADTMWFLLEDTKFPRAVAFCLDAIAAAFGQLPNNEEPLRRINQLRKRAFKDFDYANLGPEFRDHIDRLQIDAANLHEVIATTWFYHDKDG